DTGADLVLAALVTNRHIEVRIVADEIRSSKSHVVASDTLILDTNKGIHRMIIECIMEVERIGINLCIGKNPRIIVFINLTRQTNFLGSVRRSPRRIESYSQIQRGCRTESKVVEQIELGVYPAKDTCKLIGVSYNFIYTILVGDAHTT